MVAVSALDNRRQARRFPTHHPAKIMLGPEAMISCTVKDISTGGARIAVKRHMDLPETFELYIAAHDLQVRRARVCWRHGDYAGVGPGAHSHVGGVRWWNVKHPRAYAERLAADRSPAAGREVLDRDTQALERVLLGVRLAEGLPLTDLTAAARRRVAGLVADGLVEAAPALRGGDDRRLVLTLRGRLLADAVVRTLVD